MINCRQTILGSLVNKQLYIKLSFDCENMKEIKFSNEIIPNNIYSGLHLFKLANLTNSIFYIDTRMHVNVVTFDNSGGVVNRTMNLFNNDQIYKMKVVQSGNKYVIQAFFNHNSTAYRLRQKKEVLEISNADRFYNLLLIVDEGLSYIRHIPLSSLIKHIAAKSSKLIGIDDNHQFVCYDLNLNTVKCQELLISVQKHIAQTALNMVMSETHLFVLCSTRKLKIFDLGNFELVKEIDVNADQMKLVSDDGLALFDSASRKVYLFEPGNDFSLNKEVSLVRYIDTYFYANLPVTLARDQTKSISFCNKTQVVCFDCN
jgi:hypothetical protein